MKIILTGATGYVGEGTLLELLKVKEVEKAGKELLSDLEELRNAFPNSW